MTAETGIVPRWEWRTFGRHFPAAEAVFAGLTVESTHDSDEVYLLAPESRANVKVRDDLVDVKELQETDEDALQRWLPIMKAGFPVPAADAAVALRALGCAVGTDAAVDTLEDLVAAARACGVEVRAAPVHKQRVRYTIEGCMSELTTVGCEGRVTTTIAVEGTDRRAMVAAVRRLGLGGCFNTDYTKGLTALIGDDAERHAIVDVGTNSVKFHVAERSDAGWRRRVDRAAVTRLGEGLQETGVIGDEAAERTTAAIAEMATEASRHRVRSLSAVGTAGLRLAGNSAEVVAAVHRDTGVWIEVISGEEESRLAYVAAVAELDVGGDSSVVFDTGGGSSQFTYGHGTSVDARFSLQVGAVRYTERFGLAGEASQQQVESAKAAIAGDLAPLEGRPRPQSVVGMGGAITNMTAVKHGLAAYDPDVVQGTVLDREEIDRQIELYRSTDTEARRRIVGLQPNRAEVILAGACIVRTILERLGADGLVVSDRGLRHGVLVDRFGG